jgi:hypothetical protein
VPPASGRVPATLAGLDAFTRDYVARMIAAGEKIDCADLAIEIWIMFGEAAGVPTSFPIGGANVTRERFASANEYVGYVRRNLGSQNLPEATTPVSGGHRAAVAGDVFLWKYLHTVTGQPYKFGHTQVFHRLRQRAADSKLDRVEIVQGNYPEKVPEFLEYNAGDLSSASPRRMGDGEMYNKTPVQPTPQRFKSFAHLR